MKDATRTLVDAVQKLNEAAKNIEEATSTKETLEQSAPRTGGKYTISPNTEAILDCLRSLEDFYGQVLNAIEANYGVDQEDSVMSRLILDPYVALRGAIKELFLEVMEDNLAIKGSTEI